MLHSALILFDGDMLTFFCVPIDLSTYYGTSLAAPALKTVGPPKDFRLELDCDFDPCAASSDRIFMPSELPSGTDTTDLGSVNNRMINRT